MSNSKSYIFSREMQDMLSCWQIARNWGSVFCINLFCCCSFYTWFVVWRASFNGDCSLTNESLIWSKQTFLERSKIFFSDRLDRIWFLLLRIPKIKLQNKFFPIDIFWFLGARVKSKSKVDVCSTINVCSQSIAHFLSNVCSYCFTNG